MLGNDLVLARPFKQGVDEWTRCGMPIEFSVMDIHIATIGYAADPVVSRTSMEGCRGANHGHGCKADMIDS